VLAEQYKIRSFSNSECMAACIVCGLCCLLV